jgi:hypothetical protein
MSALRQFDDVSRFLRSSFNYEGTASRCISAFLVAGVASLRGPLYGNGNGVASMNAPTYGPAEASVNGPLPGPDGERSILQDAARDPSMSVPALNALAGARQFVEPTSDHHSPQELREMVEVRRQGQSQWTEFDGLDPELQRRALAEYLYSIAFNIDATLANEAMRMLLTLDVSELIDE